MNGIVETPWLVTSSFPICHGPFFSSVCHGKGVILTPPSSKISNTWPCKIPLTSVLKYHERFCFHSLVWLWRHFSCWRRFRKWRHNMKIYRKMKIGVTKWCHHVALSPKWHMFVYRYELLVQKLGVYGPFCIFSLNMEIYREKRQFDFDTSLEYELFTQRGVIKIGQSVYTYKLKVPK